MKPPDRIAASSERRHDFDDPLVASVPAASIPRDEQLDCLAGLARATIS
jgi:hypothetical protein